MRARRAPCRSRVANSWPLPVRRSWARLRRRASSRRRETPPGSPPVVGAAAPVGPQVDAATFAAAQKLVQVELTNAEREQAAQNWRSSMAALCERRTGPRKVGTRCPSLPRTRPGTPFSPDTPSFHARPVRAQRAAGRPAARCRSRDRPGTLVEAVALGRDAQAHFRAAHAHLSATHRAPSTRNCAAS